MRQSFFALNMTILPKRYRMGCLRHIVTRSRTHYDLKKVSSMQRQNPLFP